LCWILACNHEVFDFQTIGESAGGASAVRFDSGGSILDAYPILEGSHSNSRGATTPWGTWLSCQEAHQGDGEHEEHGQGDEETLAALIAQPHRDHQHGERAQEHLIKANSRLVVSVAKKPYGDYPIFLLTGCK
jgi:hypothetical protein